MTHRSRTQRILMLAASTPLVTAGVLLPTSAFAAPATPHAGTVTTTTAGHGLTAPGVEWVETTDSPSGITFKLPGKATVENFSESADGTTITGRLYTVETADGFVVFAVTDLPGAQEYLHEGLQGFVQEFNKESGETLTSTSTQKTTVDGHPALDSRLATKGSDPMVGSTRLIADDTHVTQAVTMGPVANEKAVNLMHQQVLASIHIPLTPPSSVSPSHPNPNPHHDVPVAV